jgi:hypothetical protein
MSEGQKARDPYTHYQTHNEVSRLRALAFTRQRSFDQGKG